MNFLASQNPFFFRRRLEKKRTTTNPRNGQQGVARHGRAMVLSQQDIEKAHDAFEKFDVDHSGCIDAWELKEAMKSLGQNPTDEEVFGLLAQVDTDGSGNIDFQVTRAHAKLTRRSCETLR
jgi:Ca2+-binding EF-hand superfamily protein